MVENCRTGNIFDGININSWASGGSRTDLVDNYRNPVTNPTIFAHYTQPLYVAVKIRDKVHPVGGSAVADIFVVNETNLKGKHTLEGELYDPDGRVVFALNRQVNITGGNQFGQLLVEDVQFPALDKPGWYMFKTRLEKGDAVVADGFDDMFAADFMNGPGLSGRWAVIDSSGVINTFLEKTRGITLPAFASEGPEDHYDYIVIGPHTEGRSWRGVSSRIMEMVTNGATLFVFDGAQATAAQLSRSALNLISSEAARGDRYFVGDNRFMDGLPVSQAMNWEYQEFYHSRRMTGMFIDPLGTELIVGLASTSSKNIYAALTRIPIGNGQVFLSTLNFMDQLPLDTPQSAVPKKLFMNLLENAGK